MTPLLILLLPILGQACNLERDVDYPGHDLESKHVRSEGQCAEECYWNIRCDYWTFRWTDNKCWLKHGKNGGRRHGQVVSGDKACGADCSESEPEYDTDYPESDIVNRDGIAANTQDECAEMCSNNNNCKYWTFSPGTDRCWLKNDKGRDQYRVHPRDDRVSGKRKCPAGCFREDRIDYPRGDIFGKKKMKVINEDACSKMCFDETSCNFWSYSPSQRYCWLKHTKGDNGFIHGDADRISGNKACGSKRITPKAVKMSSQFNGDFPGHNCIDGDQNTMCHTKHGEAWPWVAVEIPRSTVNQVTITNRDDCCGDRTKNMKVWVGDQLPTTSGTEYSSGRLLDTFNGPGANGQIIVIQSLTGLQGRYVIVQMSGTTINLAEIDVFRS